MESGKSPDEWETGHTAHWLDQQNQAIEAGSLEFNTQGATKSPVLSKVVTGSRVAILASLRVGKSSEWTLEQYACALYLPGSNTLNRPRRPVLLW